MSESLPLCAWCKVEHVKLRKNDTCSPSCGAALRWSRVDAKAKIDRIAACNAGRRTWMARRLAAEFRSWAHDFGIPQTHAMLKAYTRARTRGYLVGYAASWQRRRSKMIKAVLNDAVSGNRAAGADRSGEQHQAQSRPVQRAGA